MKQNFLALTLSAGCLLALASATSAGPLQRADVASDPLWVVHLDCDALKQTAIGRYVLGEMEKPEIQKKLTAFQAIFSFDPRKELHGLTLYGASKSEEDAVGLVYADFDPSRLTTLAEGAKEHKSTEHGTHTIHSWIDEKKAAKSGGKPRTYAAIHGKIVIFAPKESRVATALDVLDQAKPNLTTSAQFSRLGAGSDGAFLIGASRKIELPASDPNAAVLRQSKMLWLSVGESQGKAEAKLNLEADNEEIAKQIESVGKGLIGLIALQKDKPESVKLSQGLAIEQDGTGVMVKLSLPADDVVGMIKAKAAKKAAD